jgi:hypothetical protein
MQINLLEIPEKTGTETITFMEGDGSGIDEAIILSGDSREEPGGISFETFFLSKKLGKENRDWEFLFLTLIHGNNGRIFEKIVIKYLKMNLQETFYFDITDFYKIV